MGGALVDEARELAEMGFFVLPIVRGTKRPAFARTGPGHQDAASRDPEVVARWFAAGQHDVAVVPWLSGHTVCDVDTKNSQPGAASLPRLEEQSGYSIRRRWSDVTATALSQNRGWHYFWRLPEGVEPEELRGQLAPGVELKTRGLVVVPPSQGRRWTRHLRDGCLELPARMVELGRKPARAAPGRVHESVDGIASIGALHKWLARRTEGERNNALYWAACRAAEMLERGEIGPVHAWMLVETAVNLGLPRNEAESTVRSALSRLDADAIPVAPPAESPAQLLIPETGELVDAPAPREPFEQIPRRLADSGLSSDQLALLVHIWLRRDHRTGQLVATLADLAGTPDGRHRQARKTRRLLHDLRRLGWVDFSVEERQRRPLVLRLGRSAKSG